MATFNSNSIKSHDEQICFKLQAKKKSHLSVSDMTEYFPASNAFIAGMINLAYDEAILSFEEFYNKVSSDSDESEEDNMRYLELLNYLKAMDIENFDVYYKMSDTFVRMSIPQPVIFFIKLHKAFIEGGNNVLLSF